MNTPHYTHVEFFNATREKWDRVNVKRVRRGAVIPEEFYRKAPWHAGTQITIELAHFTALECQSVTEAMFRPIWDGRSHVDIFLCGEVLGKKVRIPMNVGEGNGWDEKSSTSSIHAYIALGNFAQQDT